MLRSNSRLLLMVAGLSVLLPLLIGCGSKDESKESDYYTGKFTPKGQAPKSGGKSD